MAINGFALLIITSRLRLGMRLGKGAVELFYGFAFLLRFVWHFE